MDKESLLKNLQDTKSLVDENKGLSLQKRRFYREPINLFFKIIIGILLFPMFSRLTGALVLHYKSNILDWLLIQILNIVVSFIITPILLSKLIKLGWILMNKTRIKEIDRRISANFNILKKTSEVPEAYYYSYAVDKFIEFILNKRADNLKEAINLLELEYKHEETMEQLGYISTLKY